MKKDTLQWQIFDFIRTFVISLIAVFLITQFIIKPIRVDGNSMYPTLNNNELGIASVFKTYNQDIKRFDIVIIKLESKEYLIKRVIGMPNEVIEYKDNILYINNEAVSEEFLDEEYKSQYPIFTEDFGPVQLSDDEYFCLGDNRINSKDSRYYGAFDAKQIKGVVNLMLWPFEVIKNEY